MSEHRRTRWRFEPDLGTSHAIQQIALQENRTIANATLTLLKEALAHRRRAERDFDKLVATIHGIPVTESAR